MVHLKLLSRLLRILHKKGIRFCRSKMSYCREEGKDKLIFVTEDDHSIPSTITLEDDDDEEWEGLIKPNGEINWDCPCLQGMAYGPCGEQFKAAFSCFHYSEVDPKGSDCIPQFRDMQECFVKYPEIYGKDDDELDDEGESVDTTVEINKGFEAAESSEINPSDDSDDILHKKVNPSKKSS